VTSTSSPRSAATALPDARELFPWPGLLALLSGIALAVVAVRTVELADAMALAGGVPWGRLLPTQGAIWLGWTLWAALMIPLMQRAVDRTGPVGAWLLPAGLVAAPVLLVPAVASPVHWFAFGGGATLSGTWLHMMRHNALTNLLLGTALAAVARSHLSLRRTRSLEVAAARLHAELADAQLETVRAQLDPHFLFNALNSIAVLARQGRSPEVEQMVTRLAGLLRHSLDSFRAQLVTLGVELTALRHYLEIEQVRHGDRLVVTVEVPAALYPRSVPSFLLQPLVENAVRHGVTDPEQVLHLAVRAEPTAAGVRLTVEDDGAGLGAGAGEPPAGVGLGHTRRRLAGLYGSRASLVLGPGDGGRAPG